MRSRPSLLRQLVGGSLTLVIPLGYALWRPRADLELYPRVTMIALVGLLSFLAVILTSTKLAGLGKPGLLRDNRLALIVLACIAVALPPLLAPPHVLPASQASEGKEFWEGAGACFAVGSLLGLVVLALVLTLDRAPRWQATSTAGVVGLVGVLALQLHCPSTHAEHLWLGHASILYVALAGVGLVSIIRARSTRH
jgi:hypothetical protein